MRTPAIVKPLDDQSQFFWWLETARTRLSKDTVFETGDEVHLAYAKGGIYEAMRLCYSRHAQSGKGLKYGPIREGWFEMYLQLCDLGLKFEGSRSTVLKMMREVEADEQYGS